MTVMNIYTMRQLLWNFRDYVYVDKVRRKIQNNKIEVFIHLGFNEWKKLLSRFAMEIADERAMTEPGLRLQHSAAACTHRGTPTELTQTQKDLEVARRREDALAKNIESLNGRLEGK